MKTLTTTIVITLLAFLCAAGQGCLPEGITFTTQEEVDNFQSNYPGCKEIQGNVRIGVFVQTNITNLQGLSGITFIGGSLEISLNDALSILSGLEDLTSIGGNLWVQTNNALASLTGLEGLATIGGDLWIGGNVSLASLAGLENLEPGSIRDLGIANNPQLAECDVEWVCDYLTDPDASVTIEDNAPGCSGIEEVIDACRDAGTGIRDHAMASLNIYPNPACNGFITVTIDKNLEHSRLACFSTSGQQVFMKEISSPATVINVSTWPRGIYQLLTFRDGRPVASEKVVVH